jgi:hypothetical protein
MISTASVPNDFGASTSLVVLVLYAVVLFGVGVSVFTRRDT